MKEKDRATRKVRHRAKALREKAGLTLEQAGERMGYDWTLIQKIEAGKRRLNEDIMLKMRDVYNCDMNDILPRDVHGNTFPELQEFLDSPYPAMMDPPLTEKEEKYLRENPINFFDEGKPTSELYYIFMTQIYRRMKKDKDT